MKTIEDIKQKALEDNIPIIMDDTLEVVGNVLKDLKPKYILEIGTAVGYSAIRFSKFLDSDGIIDTIERDEERANEAKINIRDLNLENRINIIIGDAVEILPTLNKKYDAVFIDAAKGKYPFFLKEALRLLSEKGVIIADNILYKGYTLSDYNKHKQRTAVRGLRTFLKDLEENDEFETKLFEVGDGLTITKKKVK